jgi:omega-6 fatty acid desaturase (delta-12 desaturase)
MRTGKELILASKQFTGDNKVRSWMELISTLLLIVLFLCIAFYESSSILLRIWCTITIGLLYVRMFVIYHDYQHHAILQKSAIARELMKFIGIYLLAPQNIWKRSHDHHHSHNSKLTIAGIGSYPTISIMHFQSLSKSNQRIYLINRHPLTILMGYFTLFVYWLNLRSFVQSPRKHMDSLYSLLLHMGAGAATWYYMGFVTFVLAWSFPFFMAFAIGSYLFYCQHNFPAARFRENQDWKYDHAALHSTSFMVMNPVLNWFTANIGYHHVHHLNSKIPFYRLPLAMKNMPELQHAVTTSWNPFEMIRCLRLKLWDPDQQKMLTMRQFKKQCAKSNLLEPRLA